KAKDYGIMALLAHSQTHPWDLFRFLLFSRFTRTVYLLSFSGFLLGKSYAERKRCRTVTDGRTGRRYKNDCII
ncbi:hypothetical protein, partial [Flavobacterium rhizosphaerae]